MYFKHNIHQVLETFISYSSRFHVTLRISYKQSAWVRGENTSLLQSARGLQNCFRVQKAGYPLVFGRCEQLSQICYYDLIMRNIDDGGKLRKKERGK